ncbi:MAG: tetratricopeptide (TPR) repeat protein [Planctomycetaceae bacterium]|jgi:tetratricopeptide (TPR) repeat protein
MRSKRPATCNYSLTTAYKVQKAGEFTMKFKLLVTFSLTILLALSAPAYPAGGGSMDGGGTSTPAAPKKTAQELAVINYNKGIKYRDKAWKYREKSAGMTDPIQIAKLDKKVKIEFRKAAKKFGAAIKKAPKLHEAHSSLGYALRNLSDYDASLAAYDRALELNPSYTEAIEYRGETYLALGRFEATQEAYIKLMQMDRPKADLLMTAIQKFLKNPSAGVDQEKLRSFKDWASTRNTLAQLTRDLSGKAASNW